MKIVRFLLDRGIGAMKIYPFHSADNYLTNDGLESGLKWIREIRDSVATAWISSVDCWAELNFPSALRIAKALEPYNIMYLEDAMLMQNADTYSRLQAETMCVVRTGSEAKPT